MPSGVEHVGGLPCNPEGSLRRTVVADEVKVPHTQHLDRLAYVLTESQKCSSFLLSSAEKPEYSSTPPFGGSSTVVCSETSSFLLRRPSSRPFYVSQLREASVFSYLVSGFGSSQQLCSTLRETLPWRICERCALTMSCPRS